MGRRYNTKGTLRPEKIPSGAVVEPALEESFPLRRPETFDDNRYSMEYD